MPLALGVNSIEDEERFAPVKLAPQIPAANVMPAACCFRKPGGLRLCLILWMERGLERRAAIAIDCLRICPPPSSTAPSIIARVGAAIRTMSRSTTTVALWCYTWVGVPLVATWLNLFLLHDGSPFPMLHHCAVQQIDRYSVRDEVEHTLVKGAQSGVAAGRLNWWLPGLFVNVRHN